MKTCFKCGEEKPLSDFYRHAMMADGHLGKCKECAKNDIKKNREDKADYYKAYDRKRAMLPHRVKQRSEYIKTGAGKAAVKRATRRYRKKYPEKYKAVTIAGNAIRDGDLFKEPCEVCGTEYDVHAHHDDYSKPLDVRWLCQEHHSNVHKKMAGLE